MLRRFLARIERKALAMRVKAARSIWSGPLSSAELPEGMKDVIEGFLIPAAISPDLFSKNYIWLESSGMPFLSERKDIAPSQSAKLFMEPIDRPTAYPLWFLAAFPDVAQWASMLAEEASFEQKSSSVVVRDSLYARFMTLYPEDELQDTEGYLSANFLKNLTDFYSKALGRRFECSI